MNLAVDDPPVADPYRPKRAPRTYASLISGVVLLVCVVVAAYLVLGPWSTSLLIGSVSGFQVSYVAGMAALAAFIVFALTISAKRWWLIGAIPLSVIANGILVLAVVLFPLTETKVTPILVDGCASGYIAIEESNGVGIVGVRDGLHVVTKHQYRADDFGAPFSIGSYATVMRAEKIEVAVDGAPSFSLAVLAGVSCR